MLIFDLVAIGNKLFNFRKKSGMTQSEIAEAAGISDRTYADIERGTTNMRIETLLKICNVLGITPNDILTEEISNFSLSEANLITRLDALSVKEKSTVLRILEIYLSSL